MAYRLLLFLLLLDVVMSLRCKVALPPNCHRYSTCKYESKECRPPESVSTVRGGMYCTTLVNNLEENIVGKMDCMYDQETSKTCKNQTQCIMKYTTKERKFLHCCCDKDDCNQDFIINSIETNQSTTSEPIAPVMCEDFLCKHMYSIIFCCTSGIIFILIIISIIYRRRLLRCFEKLIRNVHSQSPPLENKDPLLPKSEESNDKIDFNDLIVESCIKQGRFSRIHRGKFNNEEVAIKLLADKADIGHCKILFEHEKQIYSLPFMQHENILKYYGCSINNDSYYIITELCSRGSLRDVLSSRLLKDENELISICRQISNGIEYLHSDFRRSNHVQNRPPIAHRDFKSDNILFTNDNRLVICDFAMSLKLDQNQNYPNEQQQIGTARYMSPELLAGTIGCETNALLKCDVYALGIVLWEVLSRYPIEGSDEKYEMPFEKQLSEHGLNIKNPQVNDMLQIVNMEKPFNRPIIKSSWKKSNKCVDEILYTMEQCWDQNPEGRITAALVALRMKQL